MPSRFTRTALSRVALGATAGVLAVLPVVVSPGAAVASGTGPAATTASEVPAEAALAAGWLAGERDAAGGVPGPFAGTDWGLTVDTLWAMRAGGASAADLQRTWGAIEASSAELSGPPSWSDDPSLRFGGGTAKLLVAAESVGADPRAVGTGGATTDVVTSTLDLVATAGPQVGRIEDSPSAGYDSTNVFSQALAVIGLSGAGVAGSAQAPTLRAAVGFLQSQQCAPGWFRVFYDDDLSCDAALAKGDASGDVDGTAMAVQALVSARDAGLTIEPGALDSAVSWLVSAQQADGSFGGGSSTSGANANSTGLAAVALQLGGRTAQADRARSWVAGLQLTGSTGALAPERGAIAYDAAALADARTAGLGAQRDQWRRTTAQAVFALRPVALAALADLPVGEGQATPPTTPPPTTPPTTPPASASPVVPSTPTTRTPSPTSTPSTPTPVTTPTSASQGLDRSAAQGDSSPSVPTTSPPPTSTSLPTGTTLPLVTPARTAPGQDTAVGVATTATAAPVGAWWRSPVTLAVVVGVLLGLLVVLRPWRRLGGGAR